MVSRISEHRSCVTMTLSQACGWTTVDRLRPLASKSVGRQQNQISAFYH
jgi:hypothetical protein